MKTKILFLTLFCVCVACKKKQENPTDEKNSSNSTVPRDTAIVLSDSSKASADNFWDWKETSLNINEQPLVLEDFSLATKKLEESKISLPEDFTKSDFLNNSTGTGLEIDLIIGKIVKLKSKNATNSIYENTSYKILKSNLNLRPKAEKETLFYEQKFDSGYSVALNAIVGGISTDKKYAYSLELLKLNNIEISQNEMDKEELKNLVKDKTYEELKELYIVVGATNWFLRTTQYEESNLKGDFNYAISVDGKKYAISSLKKNEYKIAVNARPLSEFINIKK
ncbi:hypothetical protein FE904_06915 [Chryseobacterium indologenes]|uniref:hypothetical protein n=1 Tax=Chryseobacterium indologenes TaxID=253 RepID=UPI0011091812|nr:hypothetical protein [Chryseobacterium indologenes]TLX26577.1 hypothetical protein FE904_06915 [Chryseobacterium indologenes]